MSKAKEHSVIYLSPSDDPEREWCEDDVWERSIRYNLGTDFDAAQAELSALREELAKTYRSASELANAMTRDVGDLSPDFELFDYTCGVIGQIDNMYAGMRAERNGLKQRLTAAEQRNAELVELLRDVHRDCQGERSYAHQEFWVEHAIKPTESGASE